MQTPAVTEWIEMWNELGLNTPGERSIVLDLPPVPRPINRFGLFRRGDVFRGIGVKSKTCTHGILLEDTCFPCKEDEENK